MSLILDDIIIVLVIIERAVGDNVSLFSALSTLSLWTDRLVVTRGYPVAVRAMVVRTVLPDMIP